MPILNKDMQVCISLAKTPSNLGTRFHNFLYDELGLNFIYKAFTTTDLEGAIRGVRALGFRGASISMPFKEAIISLVDELEDSAAVIQSINTVVNDNGRLIGSNTDYEAVLAILERTEIPRTSNVLLRGSGGMAKAVVAAFKKAGFDSLTIVARNKDAGSALANTYGYIFAEEIPPNSVFEVLVNVTPLGMTGDNQGDLSFDLEAIGNAGVVFDVVAFPSETPLIQEARRQNKQVLTGAEVIALQAAVQFKKYTGVELSQDQIRRASEFSRN